MTLCRMFVLSFAAAGFAGSVAAAPISIDSPGGDTGASSFNWMGNEFVLDNQPGGAVNAPHRVMGNSDGDVSFFLEEPGKVSYRTEFNLSPTSSRPAKYSLGFRYGEDLSAPTPAFSDMTGFFRRISGGTEIVQQLLAGSDAANSDSVFYGSTGRTAAGGSMANQAFLTNLGFGVDGTFDMQVFGDGTANSSVTAGGTTGANFSVDLTPGGGPSPFSFNELILQVESSQGMASFADQFGGTGQQFTFTSFTAEVPEPATLGLMGIGLAGIGFAARRRRQAA